MAHIALRIDKIGNGLGDFDFLLPINQENALCSASNDVQEQIKQDNEHLLELAIERLYEAERALLDNWRIFSRDMPDARPMDKLFSPINLMIDGDT